MLQMQHHQDMLTKRLFVIGVPQPQIPVLVQEFVKWEIHSGPEWVIKRLKGLKVDLIRSRTGLPILSWIRKDKKGCPKGVIGSLFRWSLMNDRNFRKGVQVFMAYTFYILPGLSEAQREKFLSAINAPDEDGLEDSFLESFDHSVSALVGKRRIVQQAQPLVTYRGSSEKKAPSVYGEKSVPQSEKVLDDIQYLFEGGSYLLAKYDRLFSPLLKGLECAHTQRMYADTLQGDISLKVPLLGGEIHFLQEPGGKLRSIASPLRCYQEALRPLGDFLYGVVRELPWDCTFDQTKAFPHIQDHLSRGGVVHSTDLSSATDFFPLHLQVRALRAILVPEDHDHINLFIEISRSQWRSKIGNLSWKKGQPLGLYPSFASFTLTHGLLLYTLNDCRHDNSFFVVGDDVVILSDSLNERYRTMLSLMRCPWSPEKSISSDKLSEFAGKIVTQSMVLPQMKWRKLSDDNFVDIARLLGHRSRCLLTREQRRVFDWAAHLCLPIGLNFSLPGDNLVKMTQRTLEAYHPEEGVLASLMDLRGVIHRNVADSSEQLDEFQLIEMSHTFDEKVKAALSMTLFSRWEVSLLIGLDGLDTLLSALDLGSMLPLKDRPPSRVSVLQRYMRLIHQ